MHLRNRPIYFVNGTRRKAAYYTVQARELIASGWTEESSTDQISIPTELKEAIQEIASEPQEDAAQLNPVEPEEAVVEAQPKNLDEMTKAELVAYAEGQGVQFKPYSTKSEIIEACLVAQNG